MGWLARLLPHVIGALIGLALLASVFYFESFHVLRPVMVAVVVAGAFLTFIAVTISLSLPRDVAMRLLDPDELDGEMNAWLDRFAAAGFELAGPVFEVGVSPPAVLVPLVHPAHGCYGVVYRTGTLPAKVNCDIVSIFEPHGGLTTTPERGGGTLPSNDGCFMQCIETRDLAQLLQAHLDGLAWLQQNGVRVRPARAEDFEADFREAINRQRDHFLSKPLGHVIVALFRTVTHTTPLLGPVMQQKIAQRKLRRMQELGWA